MSRSKHRRGKQRGSRIYQRTNGRWYADLREFADVLPTKPGQKTKPGQHTPLVLAGEKLATTDRDVALRVAAELVAELEARRRRGIHNPGVSTLGNFIPRYLTMKEQAGKVSADRIAWARDVGLKRAREYFGADRPLDGITTADIQTWIGALRLTIGARKRPLSDQTIRHHLNVLSNLYHYANMDGVLAQRYNPVADLMDKPRGKPREAAWLEVFEAAQLIEAARTMKRSPLAQPFLYELVATMLLTGGRKSEILGLELADVNFHRKTIRIRPNRWRTLKTRTSDRSVPIWPQLEAILKPYVARREQEGGVLLFPTCDHDGNETMVYDFRKSLDSLAVDAGWDEGELHTKMFRHTYCAARLQTLDGGHPVSVYTVGKELGHGGDSMVKAVYGHLGQVRHRAKVVEYRINQHRKAIVDRFGFIGCRPLVQESGTTPFEGTNKKSRLSA